MDGKKNKRSDLIKYYCAGQVLRRRLWISPRSILRKRQFGPRRFGRMDHGRDIFVLAINQLILLLLCVSFMSHCATTRLSHQRNQNKHISTVKGQWHVVKPHQSLTEIAAIYHAYVEDLEELNGIDRTDPLLPGKKLFVPRGDGCLDAENQSCKGFRSGARDPGSMSDDAKGRGENAFFVWPLGEKGRITSRFKSGSKKNRPHEGIDISAPQGTPVHAAAAGLVMYSGRKIKGYGNLILIKHPNDMVTVYAHNRKNLVREGRRVRQNEIIAEVGQTGRATGSHLHFEIRLGETPVDPLQFLSAKATKPLAKKNIF